MKHALWLLPPPDTYSRLQKLIDALAEEHGTVLFEPHITLLGGLSGTVEDLSALTDELAASVPPISVKLAEFGFEDEYYRCLYLKVQRDEGIMNTNRMANDLFGPGRGREFTPHVSLMYCEMGAGEKRDIIAGLDAGLQGASFDVREVHLYSTEGGPDEWVSAGAYPLRG